MGTWSGKSRVKAGNNMCKHLIPQIPPFSHWDFVANDSLYNRIGALKPSLVSRSLSCTSNIMVHCFCVLSGLCWCTYICLLYPCWYSNKLDWDAHISQSANFKPDSSSDQWRATYVYDRLGSVMYSLVPNSRTYRNKWTRGRNCRKSNSRTSVLHYIYCNK